MQGIKLYYRVLDVLVADQEAKGGAASTAALLRLDSFHRALLALSFEMVVASYRMVRLPIMRSMHSMDCDHSLCH